MFEKIKEGVDHILGLPGAKEEKEEALVLLFIAFLLSPQFSASLCDRICDYIWQRGVKLPCFASILH